LHLVQIERHRARFAQPRELACVLVEQPPEVGHGRAGEPLVLQRNEELRLAGAAGGESIGPALGQEGGLPTPAHADHRERLAGDAGQHDVAPRQGRRIRGQRFSELQAQEVMGNCHLRKDNIRHYCPCS
jgi:hypothetical protein